MQIPPPPFVKGGFEVPLGKRGIEEDLKVIFVLNPQPATRNTFSTRNKRRKSDGTL
jgi:hypothetical protein